MEDLATARMSVAQIAQRVRHAVAGHADFNTLYESLTTK
jgi:malate synthase